MYSKGNCDFWKRVPNYNPKTMHRIDGDGDKFKEIQNYCREKYKVDVDFADNQVIFHNKRILTVKNMLMDLILCREDADSLGKQIQVLITERDLFRTDMQNAQLYIRELETRLARPLKTSSSRSFSPAARPSPSHSSSSVAISDALNAAISAATKPSAPTSRSMKTKSKTSKKN